MTRHRVNARGEGMIFRDIDEVHRAFESNLVDLHAKVTVRVSDYHQDDNGEWQNVPMRVETTVGRAIVSEILPKGMSFDNVDCNLTKKNISRLINTCYRQLGLKESVVFADQLMYTGFRYATLAGVATTRLSISGRQPTTRLPSQ